MNTNHIDKIPHNIHFIKAALMWNAKTEAFDFSVRTAKISAIDILQDMKK